MLMRAKSVYLNVRGAQYVNERNEPVVIIRLSPLFCILVL